MELDDLKDKWETMSDQLEKQQLLTDKLIMDLTKEKYNKNISRIKGGELFGSVICGITVLFILFNFEKLDTWYLQASGIVMLLFLIGAPILSFTLLKGFNKVTNTERPMKEGLEQFAKSKKRFVSLQKISFYMSFILFFISTLLAGKLINGIDLVVEQPEVLKYALPIGFLFVVVFSVFVFRKYNKSLYQAEQLLKDLN